MAVHGTSPSTNLPLPSRGLVPLHALQAAIQTYLQHRPELQQLCMEKRSFEEASRVLESVLAQKHALQASLGDRLATVEQERDTLAMDLQAAKAAASTLQCDLDQAEAALQRCKDMLARVEEERDTPAMDLQTTRASLSTLQNDIAQTHESHQTLEDSLALVAGERDSSAVELEATVAMGTLASPWKVNISSVLLAILSCCACFPLLCVACPSITGGLMWWTANDDASWRMSMDTATTRDVLQTSNHMLQVSADEGDAVADTPSFALDDFPGAPASGTLVVPLQQDSSSVDSGQSILLPTGIFNAAGEAHSPVSAGSTPDASSPLWKPMVEPGSQTRARGSAKDTVVADELNPNHEKHEPPTSRIANQKPKTVEASYLQVLADSRGWSIDKLAKSLIGDISHKDVDTREGALDTLIDAARTSTSFAAAFVRHGAVRALVERMKGADTNSDELRLVISATAELAASGSKLKLKKAGVVPPLIQILRSANHPVLGDAILLVRALVESPRLRKTLAKAGALPLLLPHLKGSDERIAAATAAAACILAVVGKGHMELFANAGAGPRVAEICERADQETQADCYYGIEFFVRRSERFLSVEGLG